MVTTKQHFPTPFFLFSLGNVNLIFSSKRLGSRDNPRSAGKTQLRSRGAGLDSSLLKEEWDCRGFLQQDVGS